MSPRKHTEALLGGLVGLSTMLECRLNSPPDGALPLPWLCHKIATASTLALSPDSVTRLRTITTRHERIMRTYLTCVIEDLTSGEPQRRPRPPSMALLDTISTTRTLQQPQPSIEYLSPVGSAAAGEVPILETRKRAHDRGPTLLPMMIKSKSICGGNPAILSIN